MKVIGKREVPEKAARWLSASVPPPLLRTRGRCGASFSAAGSPSAMEMIIARTEVGLQGVVLPKGMV